MTDEWNDLRFIFTRQYVFFTTTPSSFVIRWRVLLNGKCGFSSMLNGGNPELTLYLHHRLRF